MLGFETYDLRAWMHDGMTEQVTIAGQIVTTTVAGVARKRSRWTSLLAASAIGLVAAQFDLFAAPTQSTLQWRTPFGQTASVTTDPVDLLPPGHWPRVLAKLGTWRSVDEQGSSFDIDPLA